MSDNELKEWFWNKFNSCYYVTSDNYPKSLLMYYDINFIRKSKFKILQGEEIVYPTKPSGICLFEQNYENDWFNCNYDHIWSFLESNSNYNYIEIRELVRSWLKDETKLKVLTPSLQVSQSKLLLKDETKLKVLIPRYNGRIY